MNRRAQKENAFVGRDLFLKVVKLVVVLGGIDWRSICRRLRGCCARPVLGIGAIGRLGNRLLLGEGGREPLLLHLLDIGERLGSGRRWFGVDFEIGYVRDIPMISFTVVDVDVIVLHNRYDISREFVLTGP